MVSVIIPTHNRCELLFRALKSVENQSYNDYEIIVVSDASTDNTDEVMNKLCKENSRVSYYKIEVPSGANVARNTGIRKAKGEYVALLDDDDEWLQDKLKEQMKIFNKDDNIGLVYCNVNVIDACGKKLGENISLKEGNLKKEVLFGGFIHTTSTVIIKTNIAIEVGLFDESLPAMQDYDMWIRCCQITDIGLCKKCLVNYYTFGNSAREQIGNHTNKYISAFKILEKKYHNLYSKFSLNENKYRKYIIYRGLIDRAFRNNELKEYRYTLLMSLICKFSINRFKCLLSSIFPMLFKFDLKDFNIFNE